MLDPLRRDTSSLSMFLFRAALVLATLFLGGRLYQLQVIQGSNYRDRADANRFDLIEVAAPRGVMYDINGTILTRNRPSFEVGLVPDDLPFDDPETDGVDEEAAAIEEVLVALHADTDPDVALRMAELMFRRLGRADYARTVGNAGVKLDFVTVPGTVELQYDESGNPPRELQQPVLIPDISKPLPLIGLTALIQRAVELGRQGSSSQAVPVLDLVEREQAFSLSEESYRLPSVQVREVPVREYVKGDLMSHVVGFMGPIPAAQEDDYRERGYTDPNERVGLNGLEYSYQRELRGIPGYKNMEVDILGRDIRTVGEVADPVPGSNLILGVDLRLQQVMNDALQAKMD